jgi:acyl-CoA synthetase (AMP-forming)/AMP-acid ligase II
MFVDDLEQWGDNTALVTTSGTRLSYRELAERLDRLVAGFGERRRLVLIEARNELQPLLAYLACLRGRHPVMLVPGGRDDVDGLVSTYRPDVVVAKVADSWTTRPVRDAGCQELHPDLAVLLSTSGSTGTAKFVRLSRANLDANAASIASYLAIADTDRAPTSLPFHYSYGLSVVNSHLARGAAILITDDSVVEPSFWDLFTANGATSLAAVPYTFELLDRVGFDKMALPTLRCVTAAGGRVPPETVVRYARTARRDGWGLFVMYGQTEATARMSYVPPTLVERFPESIGVPIPGGAFQLRDDDGAAVDEPGHAGELVYTGPNVMMGYAASIDDLARGHEISELATGDMAVRGAEGMYSIVARKSRFLKIFGLRIGLDEIEAQLAERGHRAVCTGTDEALVVATLDMGATAEIEALVCAGAKLPPHVVSVIGFADYPLLPSGKVDYAAIQAAAATHVVAGPPEDGTRGPHGSIRRAYADVLGARAVEADDTFVGLGGDSLSYIQVEMALEKTLGAAPRDWHRTPVGVLEALESVERPKRRWRDVDISIVLRAVAITLIVGAHFHVFRVAGGAAVLLVVVGYNFARFQLPAVAAWDSPRPVVSALERILVPTVLYTVALTLLLGKPLEWPILLLCSNFVDPELNDGLAYWFIEVLAQLTLLMVVLLAIPRFRALTAREPRVVGAALLAVAVAMRVLGPLVWDTDDLLDRVPHMMLWLFAFGWCVHFAESTRDRLVLTVAAVAFVPGAFSHTSEYVLFVGGVVLLLWLDRVPVPHGIDRVLAWLAAASLYIYLTHFQFATALDKVGVDDGVLAMTTSLVGGVIAWMVAERVLAVLPRVGGVRRPQRTVIDLDRDPEPAIIDLDRLAGSGASSDHPHVSARA